jgi:prepilin-type N-terminal cleavage/methylation domain-containing protein
MLNYIIKKLITHLLTRNKCSGFTLLELMLASAVGGIVIAGGYTSYVILGKQYNRIVSFSEVQGEGIPAIRYIARDLRMAGRLSIDTSGASPTFAPFYGTIDENNRITITDSDDNCCDSVVIIYDYEDSLTDPVRCQITYSVNTSDPDNQLLEVVVNTTDSASGDLCPGDDGTNDASIVAENIEDLQFELSDVNGITNKLVDVFMIIKSETQRDRPITYTKPAVAIGNYNFNSTDKFYRDEFAATINVKNTGQ